MLASTLGTIVLLLFGSAALVAGSLNWQTASSRGGDAEQAQEAAEWGFNTLVDRLNEPGNSYLLVSNWSVASNPPTWTDTAALRSTCGISTDNRGAVSPADLVTASQTVGDRQVRYRLARYVPPQYPNDIPPPELPQACSDNFGSFAGGTVRFTVVGEVLRSGTLIASHRIERDATVSFVGESGSDEPNFGGLGGGAPISPVVTFLATGGAPGLVSLASADSVSRRPEFLYDRNNNLKKDGSDPQVERLFCLISCDNNGDLEKLRDANQQSKRYSLDAFDAETFLKLFPAQPPSSAGLSAQVFTINASNATRSGTAPAVPSSRGAGRCYPFASPGDNNPCNNANLHPSCKVVSLPTPSGPLQQVIGCRVRFALDNNNAVFAINNDLTDLPVTLYLDGEKHSILGSNAQLVNQRFLRTRASVPSSWSTLRIFGDPSPDFQMTIRQGWTLDNAKQCNNNKKQEFKFGRDVIVDGAFMWAPKGEIEFDDYSNNNPNSYYGSIWTCKAVFKENFSLLNNADPVDVRKGIDSALGLSGRRVPRRFVVRGLERSQSVGDGV